VKPAPVAKRYNPKPISTARIFALFPAIEKRG
jgi:hypothetical protein